MEINKIIMLCSLLLFVAIFIFVIASIISPKFRAKISSRQIKAGRYMIEESEDDLRVIADKTADISKNYVETITRAIKKGLTSSNKIFCKYCGEEIDEDSEFCSKCGKKLR